MTLQVNVADLEAIINQVIVLQSSTQNASIFHIPETEEIITELEQQHTREALLNAAGCVLVANSNVEEQARGRLFHVVKGDEFFCEKRMETFGAIYQKVLGSRPTLKELIAAYNIIKPDGLRNKAMRSKAKTLSQSAEQTVASACARYGVVRRRPMYNS